MIQNQNHLFRIIEGILHVLKEEIHETITFKLDTLINCKFIRANKIYNMV
jgi:hypothetical protein